jgi:hypothetical protein
MARRRTWIDGVGHVVHAYRCSSVARIVRLDALVTGAGRSPSLNRTA